MEWYYAAGENLAGPVSNEEFAELTRSGKIGPSTLVWRAGWDNWRPYVSADRPGSSGVEATATCIECQKIFPTAEMIQCRTPPLLVEPEPIEKSAASFIIRGGIFRSLHESDSLIAPQNSVGDKVRSRSHSFVRSGSSY
jgi:GYF domain 2